MIGVFGFTIAPLSFAISTYVSPNISVWSKPILVNIDKIGLKTLVESFLIPNPASTITKSTGWISPKYKNIIVVIISNSVAVPRSVSTSKASLTGLTF
ncbi:Uncharacterised protein [Staphylococcus aureus]|nr:Uncharacterised protein [Staphylococcus aureus]